MLAAIRDHVSHAMEDSFHCLSIIFGWGGPQLIFYPWLNMGYSLVPPFSVSLNFLASPLSSVWESDDTNCPAWLPLTVSICPLLLQKDPVPREMNVKTPDLLQRPFFPLHLTVLRGQKKIDLNVSPVKCGTHSTLQRTHGGSFLHLPQPPAANWSNIDFPGVCLQSL